MKKQTAFKKIIATFLCIGIASSLAACGGGENVDNDTETDSKLVIQILQRGYGTQWLYRVADAFESANSGVEVEIIEAINAKELSDTFNSGKQFNDVDIYFTLNYAGVVQVYKDTKNQFDGYEYGLADLTDLYSMTVPGENVTFGDKMNATVKDSITYEGKYYGVPWATAVNGLFYNATVYDAVFGSDYHTPRTTDELYSMSTKIKNTEVLNRNNEKANATPFIYAGALGYWSYCYLAWWAQYEGLESYNNFYEGKSYDELSETWVYSKDIFAQRGRLEGLKVLEALLSDDAGFKSEKFQPNEYNANNFRTLQTNFLYMNEYAMMPNGDWLAQESSENRTYDVRLMKTPVISTITDRLPSVNDETTLLAVIDYVDGVSAAKPAGVSDADIEEVRIARNIYNCGAAEHTAYVPAYSNAIPLAKKFLLFLATNEALKIYADNTKGANLPFDYSKVGQSASNSFFSSIKEVTKNAYYIDQISNSDIFTLGGAAATDYNAGTYDALLGAAKTSSIYRTALQIYENELVSEEDWNQMLANAGIK